MKIIDDINKRIDLLRRIDEAKKTLDTLTINWATEPEEMEFENLFGGGGLFRTDNFPRMDKIEIEPNYKKEDLFVNVTDSERIVNLIEFMASGKKVIPPLYFDGYFVVDGEKIIRHERSLMDGVHRMRIAAFLHLTEIPVVVFERIESFLFTPGKWNFEAKDFEEYIDGGGYKRVQYLEATSVDGKIINLFSNEPLWLGDNFDFIRIDGHNLNKIQCSKTDKQ